MPICEESEMNVRRFRTGDAEQVIPLIAGFRVALAELGGKATAPDCEAASGELAEHLERQFPIFVAEDGSALVGYLVCRVDGQTVWAESMYVAEEYRRRGIASALYAEAERLAEDNGSDTVYNWIHPNNDKIISFLDGRGYNVLNLVEVRRARPGESPQGTINVGRHEFRH
jgi:ribosomal protein S18 acetylase RimI-like enzyme